MKLVREFGDLADYVSFWAKSEISAGDELYIIEK